MADPSTTMITSPDNEKLKQIRKLRGRRERDRSGLFAAEGEDLIAAAEAAGAGARFVLVAGTDVEPALLDAVSALGSGSRAIGVYEQRWSAPPGADSPPALSVYLDAVADPGNVGAVVRAAHALCDGPVILGPGCADPYSPKAVRASMGSVFGRPPARVGGPEEIAAAKLALDPLAEATVGEVELGPPVVVCIGAEREGLTPELRASAAATARIPVRPDGPESLNAAMAAGVALYELGHRMAGRA